MAEHCTRVLLVKQRKEMRILTSRTQVSFTKQTLAWKNPSRGVPLGECDALRIWNKEIVKQKGPFSIELSKIFGAGEGRGARTWVPKQLEKYFEEQQCLIVHY